MVKPRKIPLIKREHPKQRSVTFSKRRMGLFSKAAEICKRFNGVQISILVKSTNHSLSGDLYSCSNGTDVVEAFLADTIPRPIQNNQTQTLTDQESMLISEIDSLDDLCLLEQRLKDLRERTNTKLDTLRADHKISNTQFDALRVDQTISSTKLDVIRAETILNTKLDVDVIRVETISNTKLDVLRAETISADYDIDALMPDIHPLEDFSFFDDIDFQMPTISADYGIDALADIPLEDFSNFLDDIDFQMPSTCLDDFFDGLDFDMISNQ
ncbi:hypothetical protein ACFE04_005693 [Oxalis oulophora]